MPSLESSIHASSVSGIKVLARVMHVETSNKMKILGAECSGIQIPDDMQSREYQGMVEQMTLRTLLRDVQQVEWRAEPEREPELQ